jgi:protein TonB
LVPDDARPVDVSAAAEISSEQHANTSAKPVLPEPPPIQATDTVTIEIPIAPDHPSQPFGHVSVIPPGGPAGTGDVLGTIGAEQLDNPPSVRVQRPPRYPYEASRDRKDGEVVVEFSVDVKGRVYGARVVSSTDAMFEEPTLQAVSQWRFEPGRRSGRAVPFHMMVPVEFHVDSD